MAKSIVVEGKTSTEAIEKGLKELNVSRDMVDVKILESETKRSFFSILTPRVVKVELTVKEDVRSAKRPQKKDYSGEKEFTKHVEKEKVLLTENEQAIVKSNIENFLNDFVKKIGELSYKITSDETYTYVTLNGENAGKLIGYRGETLNSIQTILTSIANKGMEKKAHVILDIEDYRSKRKQSLEELADKLARTVIRTGKQVTLEPMSAYERKIIHNRLQDSQRVRTYSVGEEPYRKVVIVKK